MSEQKNLHCVAEEQPSKAFRPMIEVFSAFRIPFSSPGHTTKDLKQIDACCACTACTACTACG